MTTRDYIPIVKDSEELSELYNAQIELEILKGELFIKKSSPNIQSEKEVELMAEISLASTLQDVCRERQRDLQERAKQTMGKEQQTAYNFLRNAGYFIDKKTYDKIYDSALLPRHVFKKMHMAENGNFEKVRT